MSASPDTSCSRTAPASTATCCGASDVGGHRRGRLQHLDDRLPGGGHRPLLRRPDHHLHLPADRQLRRRRPTRWSPTGPRPRGDHARGQERRGRGRRRGRLARLAARLRGARDQRRRHPRAGAAHPRPRARCAAASSRAAPEAEARERVGAEPSMEGADFAPHRDPVRARRVRRLRAARRRDRHRDQALDPAPVPRARRPAHAAALRHAGRRRPRPRPGPGLPGQRPRRSRRPRPRRRERARGDRQEAGDRHLPRAPAAVPRRRASTPSSSPSATAARTTR